MAAPRQSESAGLGEGMIARGTHPDPIGNQKSVRRIASIIQSSVRNHYEENLVFCFGVTEGTS